MLQAEETIYALASGAGRTAIGIVRLSGSKVGWILRHFTRQALPVARRAVLRGLYGEDGDLLDRALVLWFPAPKSFTGEDVAELHVHGSVSVVRALFEEFSRIKGLRPALPGEFTRRAFWHGKVDLAQAEGLADLAQAETCAQRRQALHQSEGAFAEILSPWRARLVEILSQIEAEIDFSDEPGGDPKITLEITQGKERKALEALAQEMQEALSDFPRGARLREGLHFVLLGRVNVGKSSLFNVLVQESAAITSPRAGTTRDTLKASVDIQGYPITFWDSAGLRSGGGEIEKAGKERALRAARLGDCVCLVLSPGRNRRESIESLLSLAPKAALLSLQGAPAGLVVLNKSDLVSRLVPGSDSFPERVCLGEKSFPLAVVSAKEGLGLESLRRVMGLLARGLTDFGNAPCALTRPRHQHALWEAQEALQRGSLQSEPELRAEDVRSALQSLGRITGTVDVEEVLEKIFQDFCIGK